MNVEVLGGIVRHILTGIGGVLVARGVLDAGQLDILVGSLASIVGVVWSIKAKKK